MVSTDVAEILDCTVTLAFQICRSVLLPVGSYQSEAKLALSYCSQNTSDDKYVSEFFPYDDQDRTNLIGEGHPDSWDEVPYSPTSLSLLVLSETLGLLPREISTSIRARVGAVTVGDTDDESWTFHNSRDRGSMETITIM